MADIELLLEAEKRGILPEDKKPILEKARKQGLAALPTVDGNVILQQVLSENKGYGKVFNADNTKVMFAPPDRVREGGGEFWPTDETGDPKLPHPLPGKNVIEIYDKAMMNDPARLKAHIEGELYHGMKNDPRFNKMREDFKANYDPEESARIKSGKSWWADANPDGNSNADAAIHDAYIRGVNDPSFLEGVTSGGLKYSVKQQDILSKMQNYIKTGQ